METAYPRPGHDEVLPIPGPDLNFRKKGILVIDDDPCFRELITAAARKRGVPLKAVGALGDLPSFAGLSDYDVIVVDYNLESFNGVEIAEYVEVFFRSLPVLMISGSNLEDCSAARWPACIRRFVHKGFGPYAILQRALALFHDHLADTPSAEPRLAVP